jgi:hypothetical protein
LQLQEGLLENHPLVEYELPQKTFFEQFSFVATVGEA